MIQIEKHPRLGPFGWRAKVWVGGRKVEILKVGTKEDILASARAAEVQLSRLPPLSLWSVCGVLEKP